MPKVVPLLSIGLVVFTSLLYSIFIPASFSQLSLKLENSSEARALWLTRFEYRTEQTIRETIQKAKQANINMILFQVRGQADAYYFSSYEPWAERLGGSFPGFDPLAVAIDEAHRNGIELHAWLNVFPIWSGTAAPISSHHIYNTHPEWVMVNASGVPMNPAASGYAFGSPGIPDFIDHVFNVFMEVVEKYDIDGIHLDYIRYPDDNYSYDSISINRFKQETGLNNPNADPSRWAQWRRDQVSKFVYKIYDGVMTRKPWLKVSAAVWGNYYDGFTDKLQDPRIWLQRGKIDFIAPMIYEANMAIYQARLNNHARSTWGRQVYGGIGANALQNYTFSVSEILHQIEINRQIQTSGNVIFSASSLKDDLIQSLLTGPYQDEIPAPEMDWKPAPLIAHQPLNDTENITDPYPVVAMISSPAPLIADSLLLIWSLSENLDNHSVEHFSLISDSTYQAHIPPQNNQTIYYYLLAKNESGYIARLPRWAPTNLLSFHAGPDRIKPVISYEQKLFNSFFPIDTLSLEIKLKDNLALDTNSVFVHYFWTDSKKDSVHLISSRSEDQFSGKIITNASLADTIYYYFSAHDLSQQRNRATTDIFSVPIGIEDFEGTVDGWLAESGWDVTNEQPLSGEYSLKFSPPSDISANSQRVFQARRTLNLKNLKSVNLHFWTKYKLDSDLVVGYIDVSTDNGIQWTPIGPAFAGYTANWTEYYFSLSEYCGRGKPEILIRFRAQSIIDPGEEQIVWLIDDLALIGEKTAVLANDRHRTVPNQLALYQNYPNPFNSVTVIVYEINSLGLFVELNILNIKGQKIKTLLSKRQNRGRYFIAWNGKDERGLSVPSGVYFYQLRCSDFNAVRKMIIVR